jgi:two-component system OmpR family response regulator
LKILLVEDEAAVSVALVNALGRSGFPADHVATLEEADAAVRVYDYGLLILDRMLPDGDGLDFLAGLRRGRKATPAIVISSVCRSVAERISGLDGGADDYLYKPVDPAELIARVRALMRRPAELAPTSLSIGNLVFDCADRSVMVAGSPLPVARRELGLLDQLVRARGRVVSRDSIEAQSYGFHEDVTFSAIDVSVHRLRKALLAAGSTAELVTIRGVGYILRDRDTAHV